MFPSDVLDGFGVESPAYVVIRFLLFAGTTILLGALSLLYLVLPRVQGGEACNDAIRAAIEHRTQRWIQWALIALAVITVLRLGAQHAAYFGSRGWSRGTLGPLLLQSMWGTGWLLTMVALTMTAAGLHYVGDRGAGERGTGDRTRSRTLLGTGAIALSLSTAMSGHAAGADHATVAMLLDTMHVIGAGGWMGTLALVALVAIPTLREPRAATGADDSHAAIARLIAAFSPVALAFAAILTVTGVVAGWRNIGTLHALFTSDYGLMLVRKLVVVALAAMIGAYNWQRVVPRLGDATASQRLRRSAAIELTAGVVVLALTAVLVATSPP